MLDSVTLDATKGEVAAKAKGNMLTSLLKAVGINEIGFKANSTVKRGKGTVEVALVLDNSGSMAGTYIADLRTAAENLVNVVFTGFEGTDKVKVAVVPFAASVNVGPANANAAWMDTMGLAPVHFENFDRAQDPLRPAEADGRRVGRLRGGAPVASRRHRQHTYRRHAGDAVRADVQSRRARRRQLRRQLVRQQLSAGLRRQLSRAAAPPASRPTRRAIARNGRSLQCSPPRWRRRAPASTRTPFRAAAQGPNYLCDSAPILPLTKDKSAVLTLIKSMQAKGGTNILEGVMWGWRVLSPEPPFTEARAWNDPENNKFLIVMTDGENWHQSRSNHNKSSYHSFGYAAKGRLGETYTSSALVGADEHQDGSRLPERQGRGHQGLHRRLPAGRLARQRARCWLRAPRAPPRPTSPATARP